MKHLLLTEELQQSLVDRKRWNDDRQTHSKVWRMKSRFQGDRYCKRLRWFG